MGFSLGVENGQEVVRRDKVRIVVCLPENYESETPLADDVVAVVRTWKGDKELGPAFLAPNCPQVVIKSLTAGLTDEPARDFKVST